MVRFLEPAFIHRWNLWKNYGYYFSDNWVITQLSNYCCFTSVTKSDIFGTKKNDWIKNDYVKHRNEYTFFDFFNYNSS